ncbi:methyltransferase [Aureococcus anophagefferens]|nr:methyltransferase [Aureococcus anophagefferens]
MAPLAFCAVLITLGTRSEFAQCKAGYCLVRRSAAEAEGLATARRARRWCRLAVCGFLSFQRVSLVLYYVDVSSQMMGTADGSRRRVRRATTLQSDARRRPFNLMLNALAMVFILDLDDLILFDMLASAPDRVRQLYNGMGWIFHAGICVLIIVVSSRMQRVTATGELVTVDDDSMYGASAFPPPRARPRARAGPHRTRLTAIYSWIMYGTCLLVVADAEIAAYLSTRNLAMAWSTAGALARSLAWAACQFVCLTLIRHVFIRWTLGCLIPFSLSYKSWPLDFWGSIDPAPNRPKDHYDARLRLRLRGPERGVGASGRRASRQRRACRVSH